MAPFIFKRRNLIHIIDLRATLRGIITGRKLAQAIALRGQYVLFVGTKKQAADVIAREAARCGMPYVAERWPGGLLTNFVTIRQRLDRLAELDDMEQTGQIALYSKKMVSSLRREKRRILRNLGGVRTMDRVPGLLVIVDPAREHIAVKEARKLGIPIVALTDTDGDPDELDVVVPGNDDSFGAIEIFLKSIADAVLAGVIASGRPVPEVPLPESVAVGDDEEGGEESEQAGAADTAESGDAAEDEGNAAPAESVPAAGDDSA
jgi:small subunit ribosomal protein S2